MNQSVYALTTFSSNLYAGGNFTQAGGNPANTIAQWNGTSWSNLGTGTDGGIGALGVYNNELYAGGVFFTAGGNTVGSVAKWNGTTWLAPGFGFGGSGFNSVNCFGVYNGELFIGGGLGPGPNNIIKWDGSTTSNLGSGLTPVTSSHAFALIPYQGELYVGGSFSYAGPIQRYGIAKWNDTSWSAVGTTSTGTSVRAFAIHNGDL